MQLWSRRVLWAGRFLSLHFMLNVVNRLLNLEVPTTLKGPHCDTKEILVTPNHKVKRRKNPGTSHQSSRVILSERDLCDIDRISHTHTQKRAITDLRRRAHAPTSTQTPFICLRLCGFICVGLSSLKLWGSSGQTSPWVMCSPGRFWK